ncbi:shikimate kinase [Qiania dongpingensis]|uniref:Shikimate kinase n=2 Tax=Qiania dongpingensis TaxID=2763669 RepID=A0A7G9G8A7_9FIRM|nr:shikimate kinase [Qiania dongpingensis]
MMNIALIGFMGVGKTTVSHALSERLGIEETDIDQWIVEKTGRPIAEIFEKEGEQAFRDRETEAIKELASGDGRILSCGGGAVLRACNVEALKRDGVIVLLTAEPETIFERVRCGKSRPVLNGNMNVGYIAHLMEKRRPAYEAAADFAVPTDGKPVEQIAEEIAERIGDKL